MMIAASAAQNKQSPAYSECFVIICTYQIKSLCWFHLSCKKKYKNFNFVTTHFFLHRGILGSNTFWSENKKPPGWCYMFSSTEQTPLCSRTDHCENLDIDFLLHTETWWLHWWRVLNESFALEDKVQKQFQEASRLDAACFEDQEWLQKVASLLFQLIHAMIMAAGKSSF